MQHKNIGPSGQAEWGQEQAHDGKSASMATTNAFVRCSFWRCCCLLLFCLVPGVPGRKVLVRALDPTHLFFVVDDVLESLLGQLPLEHLLLDGSRGHEPVPGTAGGAGQVIHVSGERREIKKNKGWKEAVVGLAKKNR